METPKTLMAAIQYFADPYNALRYFASSRWPNGVECPYCQGKEPMFLVTRRIWKCRVCRKQFSVKVGTIFNESPIGIDKWLMAIWMIANCKNGVSSYEIARDIKVTQKTAWFMLHRIRRAMQEDGGGFLAGEIEADESFISGKARNMHKGRWARKSSEPNQGKAIVAAVLQRGGRVRAAVVSRRKKEQLKNLVSGNVEAGSNLYTRSYDDLGDDFKHQVVNHADEYVRGSVHTNGLENFWSLFKRGLNGTYVSVEPYHLFRYVDEQSFRFNERHLTGSERFEIVCARATGRRLTWDKLTGKLETPTAL